MGTKKTFRRFFDFTGSIDYRKSVLKKDPDALLVATNVEQAVDTERALQTRNGFQIASSNVTLLGSVLNRHFPEHGLHRFSKLSRTNYTVTEEVLGVRQNNLFVLKEGALVVQYGGAGTTSTAEFKPSAQDTYQMVLKVNGAAVATISITSGLATTSPTTLQSLVDSINAVANWTATLTPNAKVNGAQAGVTTVTVDSGHTVTIGDIYPIFDRTAGLHKLRRVRNTTATTLVLDGSALGVSDNDSIGIGIYPAAGLLLEMPTAKNTLATAATFKYEWFQCAQTADRETVADNYYDYYHYPYKKNTSFANVNDVTYWIRRFASTGGLEGRLYKYDGVCTYRAGLDAPPAPTLAAVAGTIAAGTYYYKLIYQCIDGQENTIISETSARSAALTHAGANDHQVTITPETDTELNTFAALINGAQAGVTTITVDTAHRLVPGMKAVFRVTSGAVERRTITAVAATTITISGAAVTVADNEPITNDFTVLVYRTKAADPYNYYYVDEYPNNSIAGTTVVTVSKADADLGDRLNDYLNLGTGEPAPDTTPPGCSLVCEHQGVIVLVLGVEGPNTIIWSDVENLERFPQETNFKDIPTTTFGGITAIQSDTESMLAVFKDSSYFNVVGDLVDLTFEVIKKSEGSIGCPHHGSICKQEDVMFFVSNKGPMALRAGQVDQQFSVNIRPLFHGNYFDADSGDTIASTDITKLVPRGAVSVNDTENNRILFFIPALQGQWATGSVVAGSIRPSNYSRMFVYDYIEKTFGEFDLYDGNSSNEQLLNFAGGAVLFKNRIYALAQHYRNGRSMDLLRSIDLPHDNAYLYHDHTYPIVARIRPQWITEDEPDVFKYIQWVKIWSTSGNQIRPFTVRLRSYKDFQTSTTSTDTNLTFLTGDVAKKVKMRDDKFGALALDFEVSTLFEKMSITGFQYLISVDNDEGQQKD